MNTDASKPQGEHADAPNVVIRRTELHQGQHMKTSTYDPAQWKLVPVALTEVMHAAAVQAVIGCYDSEDPTPSVYRAMLAAAPAQTWRSHDNTGMRYPEESDLSGGETDCTAHHTAQAEAEGTVPWPQVMRYSGGASPEGVAGRVWIRLADDGPQIEYAPVLADKLEYGRVSAETGAAVARLTGGVVGQVKGLDVVHRPQAAKRMPRLTEEQLRAMWRDDIHGSYLDFARDIERELASRWGVTLEDAK